jgi:uncharacterized protein YijF (DUF1287 family)
MTSPQISIADLYSMKNKKDKIKITTFNVIIEKCHTKIKTIAQQGGMNVFYEIPYVLLGYPLYDINECIDYVIESLRKNTLLVQILPHPNNNTIYISWKPDDVSARKQLTSSKHEQQAPMHMKHPFGIRPKKLS